MCECAAPSFLFQQFSELVGRHPTIGRVLDRWHAIGLPDAWLTGSIMAQARWNEAFGNDPNHGINDVDIVYFDATDLSAEAEEREEARIADLFDDLPVRVDIKNQARVHLWYPGKFGDVIAPYRSMFDAIRTYPTTAAAVGLRRGEGLEVMAPFGLSDLLRPVVRANATQIRAAYFAAKAARWRTMWPDLAILPWAEAVRAPAAPE